MSQIGQGMRRLLASLVVPVDSLLFLSKPDSRHLSIVWMLLRGALLLVARETHRVFKCNRCSDSQVPIACVAERCFAVAVAVYLDIAAVLLQDFNIKICETCVANALRTSRLK